MIKHINKQTLFYLLPFVLLLLYLIVKNFHAPIGDFGNYYYGSKFLIEGKFGSWIYNAAQFNLKVYELGERNFFLNYTPVPPFSALCYVPFTFFDASVSKVIFNIFSCLLLCYSLVRLCQYLKIPNLALLAIPILFYGPIQSNIFQGQGYFIILFLITEGFFQYDKGNKWIAVLLWALAIHLKITPAIVVFFLLFQKDFKAIIFLFAGLLILYFISLPFVGNSIWFGYIFQIIPRVFNGDINDTYALSYQSMQVLLKNLFVPDLMLNRNAPFNKPELYEQLLLAFKIVVFSIGFYFSVSKIGTINKFSIWLIISTIISGYGTTYGLIILLFPIMVLYKNSPKTINYLLPIVLLCLLVTNIPFYWYTPFAFAFKFIRLYALLGLLLWCFCVFKPKAKWYLLIAPFFVFLLPIKAKNYPQNYLFKKEEALLIYDFKILENQVLIHYFNNLGPQTKCIPLGFKVFKAVNHYNPKSFLFDYFNPKSVILNNSIYIYLSDENRGVGFATLRITNK